MQEKLKRCFISIELPCSVIKEITRIQKLIQKEFMSINLKPHSLERGEHKNFLIFSGKFTEPENLHLTLKFLGEISDNRVLEVIKSLEKISFEEFDTELGELGVFDNRNPRIIWIKLNNADKLQRKIDEFLMDFFKPEERFMGHITIARIKKDLQVSDKRHLFDYLKSIKTENLKFAVKEFILKESELLDKGPAYHDIKKFPLKYP